MKNTNPMKKTILSIGFLLLTSVLFAQYPISKGETQLNAGVGFSGWGTPIYVGFDYGVHPDISLGGEFSFRSYHSHSVIGILGHGNFHFNRAMNIPSPWDFYAGLNLGFYSGESINSNLGLGAQVGGRYYFSRSFGINLEFGGGNRVSGGKFGVTFKL